MEVSNNKSDIYGNYGGVSKENHYIPPPAPAFVPQPATVPYTQTYRQTLMHHLTAADVNFMKTFITANSANIMFRNMLIERGGNKEFVMFTRGNPNDLLTFTANVTGVPSEIISPATQPIAPPISSPIDKTIFGEENITLEDSGSLISNKNYFINTSTHEITAALPEIPEIGDYINIQFTRLDYDLILISNTNTIETSNVKKINRSSVFGVCYINNTIGWKYISDSGEVTDMLLLDGGKF